MENNKQIPCKLSQDLQVLKRNRSILACDDASVIVLE